MVSPLTRDQEDTIVRNRNSDEKPSVLQFGEGLVTKWPHENIHALGLAKHLAKKPLTAGAFTTRFDLSHATIVSLLDEQYKHCALSLHTLHTVYYTCMHTVYIYI